MFSSSSRQRDRRLNPDGSSNIYCFRCNEFIGRAFMATGRAVCEICRRIENGEPITEEAVRDYQLAKGPHAQVSMLLVPEMPKTARKFTLRSLGGDLLEAVGLGKPKKAPPKSAEISKGKRRGRLFEGVALGNMQEIDAKLKGGEQP